MQGHCAGAPKCEGGILVCPRRGRPTPSMALQLIGDKLLDCCTRLMKFPSSRFWIHETLIATELGLPRGPAHGPSDVLTSLLAAIRVGHGGDLRRKTFRKTGVDAIDLRDENNGSRVIVQQSGRQEAFNCGHLNEKPAQRKPKWFRFRPTDETIEREE